MTEEEVREALREAREESGMTYLQAADECEVAYDTFYGFLSGRKNNPGLRVVLRMCEGLGLEVSIRKRRHTDGMDQD